MLLKMFKLLTYTLPLLQVIVCGDSTTGKSSLAKTFYESKWDNSSGLTIGVDFFAKIVPIKNKKLQVKLQIWDTAGQEKFRSIIKSYFRNTVGVILVYDITNRNSFLNINDWLQDVKRNLDYRNACFMLIGTKSDLGKLRQVKEEEARQFAKFHNMLFKETSAKLNLNVQEAFTMIAEAIYDKVESGEFNLEECKPAITHFTLSNNNQILNFPIKRLRSIDEGSNRCKC